MLLAYQDTKHELNLKHWKTKANKEKEDLFYFWGQLEATYNSLEWKHETT